MGPVSITYPRTCVLSELFTLRLTHSSSASDSLDTNRLLREDVQHLIERFEALPAPISPKAGKTFKKTIAKEHRVRLTVHESLFHTGLFADYYYTSTPEQSAPGVRDVIHKDSQSLRTLERSVLIRAFAAGCVGQAGTNIHLAIRIVARLRKSGWDQEVDFLGDEGRKILSDFPVVRQSSRLTEGGEYDDRRDRVPTDRHSLQLGRRC